MPVPFPDAFFSDEREAVQTQAALLLYLGLLAHRERQFDQALVRIDVPLAWENLALEGDDLEMGIPERLSVLRENRRRKYDMRTLRRELAEGEAQLGGWFGRPGAAGAGIPALQRALTSELFREPDYLNAAKLVAISMHHADELVRVAAASTSFDVILGAGRLAGEILIAGTYSDDSLIRDVAATALGRVAPTHPRIFELTAQGVELGAGRPANTSLIVHGTWARNVAWWQPGEDFHDYLLTSVDPTLYAGLDRYDWSGGYSDHARAIAALDLVDWTMQMNWSEPDFFTHSHGGSVAMLANRAMDISKLVLLSCPVHQSRYWPVLGRVRRVISVRVRMDLVILADRGGQRFVDPDIEENVLPIWFDHAATHDPATWMRYDVPAMIA